MLKELYNFSKL